MDEKNCCFYLKTMEEISFIIWVVTITANPGYVRGREGSKGVRTHVHTIFVEPQVTGVTANSTLVPCDR